MKIQEDPWDNYLYYDSRYIIPIFCHQDSMPIEKQTLAAFFIKKSIDDETISQYKVIGSKLLDELFNFIENDFVDAGQLLEEETSGPSLLQRIKLSCECNQVQDRAQVEALHIEVERALRLFMLHMQVKGKLHEFKQDYFV